LYDSVAVGCWVAEMNNAGKVVSAICAAPIVLAKAGLLAGRRFTMYPGFDRYLNGAQYSANPAEIDGNIVTGKGPGAVFAFSQQLTAALGLEKEFSAVSAGMFLPL
jgi:putative intracellular protease/amidase